jgi:hypothetical protein
VKNKKISPAADLRRRQGSIQQRELLHHPPTEVNSPFRPSKIGKGAVVDRSMNFPL